MQALHSLDAPTREERAKNALSYVPLPTLVGSLDDLHRWLLGPREGGLSNVPVDHEFLAGNSDTESRTSLVIKGSGFNAVLARCVAAEGCAETTSN